MVVVRTSRRRDGDNGHGMNRRISRSLVRENEARDPRVEATPTSRHALPLIAFVDPHPVTPPTRFLYGVCTRNRQLTNSVLSAQMARLRRHGCFS